MHEQWSELSPRFAWRPSQQHLLELAGHVADRRWHLCAPPGAGKTLIGLELARQVGAQTLVLAPTTAIRDQWREATRQFGADPDRFTATDPAAPVPLRTVTYQLLGNPGDAAAELRAAARRLWVADVARVAGLDADAAEQRVATTERDDAPRARRELRRHVRALRRTLAGMTDAGLADAGVADTGSGAGVADAGAGAAVADAGAGAGGAERIAGAGLSRRALLGPRPLALVDELAASGIGCVVLDECHHLLDWWALVVGALVERLEADGDVAVIGLTATLPDPDSAREAENYRGLLGDVDAELQLAALVAEGAVAPWRDGVRLAQLTGAEQRFVDESAGSFAAELDELLAGEPFVAWAVGRVTHAALDARAADGEAEAEQGEAEATDGEVGSAVDGRAGDPTDTGAGGTVGQAGAWDRFWDRDPVTAAGLARWWARRGLALPAGFDPPPQARAADTLDLGDRLHLLDAWLHDPAVEVGGEVREATRRVANRYGVAITTAGVRWTRSPADLVCALSSSKGAAAADILAEEAARRGASLRALVVTERDQATSPPAAVRRVLGEDAGTAARALAALCARPEVAELGVLLVTGRGAWADALSAERIAGAVNVSVGGDGRWVAVEGSDVRGAVRLAGMGRRWSAADWLAAAEVALDDGAARVLIATRGLVGEGWDHPPLNVLVDLSEVASPTATTQLRGRAIRVDPADPDKLASLWDVTVAQPAAPGDWLRLRRRHAHWWGPGVNGTVTTGPGKLHPLVADADVPTGDEVARINADSAAMVADEAAARHAWARVDPGGIAASAVRLHRMPRPRRRQVRSRGARWVWEVVGLVGGASAATGTAVAAAVAAGGPVSSLVAAAGATAAALAFGAGVAVRGRRRDERATLRALAEGVAAGVVATGHTQLAGATVVVEEAPGGGWLALVDDVPDDGSELWADALAETLGPLGTPRWLVALRGTDSAWRVPALVGGTRQAAETFARAMRSRLPGTELVRAGTPRATELVLAARPRGDEIERSLHWR